MHLRRRTYLLQVPPLVFGLSEEAVAESLGVVEHVDVVDLDGEAAGQLDDVGTDDDGARVDLEYTFGSGPR